MRLLTRRPSVSGPQPAPDLPRARIEDHGAQDEEEEEHGLFKGKLGGKQDAGGNGTFSTQENPQPDSSDVPEQEERKPDGGDHRCSFGVMPEEEPETVVQQQHANDAGKKRCQIDDSHQPTLPETQAGCCTRVGPGL